MWKCFFVWVLEPNICTILLRAVAPRHCRKPASVSVAGTAEAALLDVFNHNGLEQVIPLLQQVAGPQRKLKTAVGEIEFRRQKLELAFIAQLF